LLKKKLLLKSKLKHPPSNHNQLKALMEKKMIMMIFGTEINSIIWISPK
jgi:hypothetical protein